jgi:HNH endonuclease/AP2 domain
MNDDLYRKSAGPHFPLQGASPLLDIDEGDLPFAACRNDSIMDHRGSSLITQQEGACARRIHFSDGTFTLVDAEDYPFLSELIWSRGLHGGGNTYVYRYETAEQDSKKLYIHRVILAAGPNEMVDHINGDTLDNRQANLRITTSQGNAQNRAKVRTYKKKRPTSPYKGVSRVKARGMYRAYMHLNGKQIHLGYFADPIEAAKAYDRAVTEHYDVCRLNFAHQEED